MDLFFGFLLIFGLGYCAGYYHVYLKLREFVNGDQMFHSGNHDSNGDYKAVSHSSTTDETEEHLEAGSLASIPDDGNSCPTCGIKWKYKRDGYKYECSNGHHWTRM